MLPAARMGLGKIERVQFKENGYIKSAVYTYGMGRSMEKHMYFLQMICVS